MAGQLADILAEKVPAIHVVDVGAMMLEQPPYHHVLTLPKTTLLGFEPGDDEREKLEDSANPGHKFLPFVVGRGGPAVFRSCEWNATSSLYEPNTRLLERFSGMAELHVVAERIEVETVALDDIPLVQPMSFLKMDVQGAELDIVMGAERSLKDTLVIHAEVLFVPMYENAPGFGDLDVALRARGFHLHHMTQPGKGTFAPLTRKPGSVGGQWLWADVVYVRDFMKLASLEPDQLLALALILARCYGAHDFALLALQHYDAKMGTRLWSEYSLALTGTEKAPRPL